MSKSNTFETGVLNLVFVNTDLANIGDATGLRGSSTAGSLYVSLHTSDPGEAGSPSTNETVYTNYARVAVARTSGGWTVSGNQVSNTAAISFPQCGATGATITHFGVSTASSGGTLLFKGALSSSLAVSNGITPQINAGALTVTED